MTTRTPTPNRILAQTDHRPWLLPPRKWAWRQTWRDLLFAHWRIAPASLRPLVPAPLELDLFEGEAWIGIVPFRMTGIAHRGLPPVPGLRAFPELNVRTYVRHGDRPGVWFFSLDATSPIAVRAARSLFHLPYVDATITARDDGERIHYDSRRRDGSAALRCVFGPTAPPESARANTLEHFLTERYCLYARSPRSVLYRGDVHHAPWPLQRAEATFERNGMVQPLGLTLPGHPPLLHFARRIDVVVWSLERVA